MNDKLSILIIEVKNQIFKFFTEHPWCSCLSVFALLIIIANFFTLIHLLPYDPENARYLISALIQSQAAIISIVITLSLVAIQITASRYTPRLIDIFKEYPLMWLLLGFYLISITFNIYFLNLISPTTLNDFLIRIYYSFCIYYSLTLFFFLLFYIRIMMNLLKVTTLLGILSHKLSPNICDTNVTRSTGQVDIWNTYFDILNSAILKFDIPTVRTGLFIISDRFIDICKKMTPQLSSHYRLSFSSMFADELMHTARVAGNAKYRQGLIETISTVSWTFQEYYSHFKDTEELPAVFTRFINTLIDIHNIAIENSFEAVAVQVRFEMDTFGRLIEGRDDLKAILSNYKNNNST